MHVMFQVLALVGRMGVSGAYGLIYVFFTELIPTVVRNMGFGVVSTAARIGSIICPYVIYMGKCFLSLYLCTLLQPKCFERKNIKTVEIL